jgi:hypothetical protein
LNDEWRLETAADNCYLLVKEATKAFVLYKFNQSEGKVKLHLDISAYFTVYSPSYQNRFKVADNCDRFAVNNTIYEINAQSVSPQYSRKGGIDPNWTWNCFDKNMEFAISNNAIWAFSATLNQYAKVL